MIKIKEKGSRKKLNEGRDHGIGFTFLKKINNTEFESYFPFTACRDFLNDFTYIEAFKDLEFPEVYGFKHNYTGDFNRKHYFYLGVNCLHYNGSRTFDNFDECLNLLINNHLNLLKVIHYFEEKFNLKNKTKLIVTDDCLIFRAPKFWMKSTPLISLYSLIIRLYFNIGIKDNENILEILTNHKPFLQSDSYYTKYTLCALENLNLNYIKIEYPQRGNAVHNFGIHGFLLQNKISIN